MNQQAVGRSLGPGGVETSAMASLTAITVPRRPRLCLHRTRFEHTKCRAGPPSIGSMGARSAQLPPERPNLNGQLTLDAETLDGKRHPFT